MPRFQNLSRRLIWIAGLLIASAVIVVVVVQARRPASTSRKLYMVGVPQKGSALFYGNKQCHICHSMNGSGGRIAPDLSGRRPENPAMGWLVAVMWNHGPGMWRVMRNQKKSLPDLNPQELADLLAFMYQASNEERPGDPKVGNQLFTDKGCIKCHSIGGTGGKAAPDLSAIAAVSNSTDWTSAMLSHAGSMIEPVTKTLGEWPQFKDREMGDLIAYVRQSAPPSSKTLAATSANAERGWTFFQGHCIQCHSVRGQGGGIGPALGPEHDLPLSAAQFSSVMWNHAPAMLKQSKEKGIPAPVLKGNDMADLLAFLASLRYFEPSGSPQIGAQVFAERGCATCHGSSAEGTKMGPALTAGAEPLTVVSLTSKLWRHGPRMIDRAEEMGIPWPTLKPTDVGNLVSFLNAPQKK